MKSGPAIYPRVPNIQEGQVESSSDFFLVRGGREQGTCGCGWLMCPPLKDNLDSENLYVRFNASNGRVYLIWLVGCFGFSGPLRQYFSLYRAVSQREGERVEEE